MNTTFHLQCLRDAPPEPGPGTLTFMLRRPLALRGPHPDEITVLVKGQTLFNDTVACVREALALHLDGPTEQSGFRQGVAALLGVSELSGDPDWTASVERAIGIYSGKIAVVRILYDEPACEGPVNDGLFNRMRAEGLSLELAGERR